MENQFVSTNVFGICEQFTHGHDAFLFEINYSNACYKYLETLIDNNNLRNQIGQNAKKSLYDKFNIDNNYKKYIELIERNYF